jgi:hypothetical protein
MSKKAKEAKFPTLRLLIEFPFSFFKSYILRGYIFAGRQGFVNAVAYAFSRFMRIAKYLEKKQQK